MDILFENKYQRTETIYKEMYQYLCFKTPMRIFFDIIIGLSFILNIFFIISGEYYTISVLFFVPIFFGIQFYQYFKAVKLSIKRQAEISSKDDVFIDIIITDTEILSKASTGAETKTSLSKIKKLIKTKNLIMLQTEAKLIYIFHKDAFTTGSANEFLTFLKTKGLYK